MSNGRLEGLDASQRNRINRVRPRQEDQRNIVYFLSRLSNNAIAVQGERPSFQSPHANIIDGFEVPAGTTPINVVDGRSVESASVEAVGIEINSCCAIS